MIVHPEIPDDDRFHSVHVPTPKPGCKKLRWERPRKSENARVRDYTCNCQNTFYELCQAGGQLFIRRSRRRNGKLLIDECARGRSAKALEIWGMVVLGDAA